MKEYTTVLRAARSRFEDRKSVFYGLCTPATTEDEALSFIAAAKKEFPDAIMFTLMFYGKTRPCVIPMTGSRRGLPVCRFLTQ